jgi:hypothetical protein
MSYTPRPGAINEEAHVDAVEPGRNDPQLPFAESAIT